MSIKITAPQREYANGTPGRDDEENVIAASVRELPCLVWDGLWDGLIYVDNIKLKLSDYIHATFALSEADVDFNLMAWSRVVLLHGPPGTDPSLTTPAPEATLEKASNSGFSKVYSSNTEPPPDPNLAKATLANTQADFSSIKRVSGMVQNTAPASDNLQSVPDTIDTFSLILALLKAFNSVR
ncbi:hypothetical protein EDB19DRAFT_1902087 [Suillus lakei]|nr:hypothetical protein EDB19DRAFT_1902087 [Suillus lakei]